MQLNYHLDFLTLISILEPFYNIESRLSPSFHLPDSDWMPVLIWEKLSKFSFLIDKLINKECSVTCEPRWDENQEMEGDRVQLKGNKIHRVWPNAIGGQHLK